MWNNLTILFDDMMREIMSLGKDFYSLRKTLKRVEDCKQKARPELKLNEWEALNYADTFDLPKLKDTIERIDGRDLSLEKFRQLYERPRIPVILTGMTEEWAAHEKWTFQRVARKYRNQKFKCGEDDDGYSVKMKMKYYYDYLMNNKDDSPLYIFDSSFGERHKIKKLLDDYEVPLFFKDDLFNYADHKKRPPHRWFVLGPTRSGTAIHIDPLGTSAWNSLIQGHKRWVLLPPHVPKELIKPMSHEKGKHPSEAITWFNTVYKRIRSPAWPKEYPYIECRQSPGETMFVPAGWWHVVINEDDTIAITQNYCSVENLHLVWPKTQKSRPKLSKHWLRKLTEQRPEVLPIIEAASSEKTPIDMNDSSSDSSSSSSSSDEDDTSDNDSGCEQLMGGTVAKKRKCEGGQDDQCPEKTGRTLDRETSA